MTTDSGQRDLAQSGSGAPSGTTAEAGRPAIAGAHRRKFKIGSSSLTTPTGGIDPGPIQDLVDGLAVAWGAGREVVLVSTGPSWPVCHRWLGATRPRDLATQQAAASVGQGLLSRGTATHLFAAHRIEVGQVLLTVEATSQVAHADNRTSTAPSVGCSSSA